MTKSKIENLRKITQTLENLGAEFSMIIFVTIENFWELLKNFEVFEKIFLLLDVVHVLGGLAQLQVLRWTSTNLDNNDPEPNPQERRFLGLHMPCLKLSGLDILICNCIAVVVCHVWQKTEGKTRWQSWQKIETRHCGHRQLRFHVCPTMLHNAPACRWWAQLRSITGRARLSGAWPPLYMVDVPVKDAYGQDAVAPLAFYEVMLQLSSTSDADVLGKGRLGSHQPGPPQEVWGSNQKKTHFLGRVE